MEPEQLRNFHERLNRWVAGQGFWFQARYLWAGKGGMGRLAFLLLKMTFRLLVFLLFVAAVGWVVLAWRTDMVSFRDGMRGDLQAALGAKNLEVLWPKQKLGTLVMRHVEADGSGDTFFSFLSAQNVRCKMEVLDGLWRRWKPGVIEISRLEMDLNAGAEDEASAQKLAQVLFQQFQKEGWLGADVDALEVESATFRWGLSEQTRGAIERSKLMVQRTENGWRLHFTGGYFSQNWLSRLEIVDLVVVCDPDGMVFEKADLKQGESKVDFAGVRLQGGVNPVLSGVVKIRHLSLEGMLPAAVRPFVEGSISGDFQVSGSTNTADGVVFESWVELREGDVISLRERIHLLKALSVVDDAHDYRRLDFRSGSFRMRTSRGGVEISEMSLDSEKDSTGKNACSLEGAVSVFLPSQKEILEAMEKRKDKDHWSTLFAKEEEVPESTSRKMQRVGEPLEKSGGSDMERTEKEKEADRSQESADERGFSGRLKKREELRRSENLQTERMSRLLRYYGMLRLALPGDSFEKIERLRQVYPVDMSTGKRPLLVPIEGYLYELTLKQAEEIYLLRRSGN